MTDATAWHATTCFSQNTDFNNKEEAGRGSNDLLMRLGNVCYSQECRWHAWLGEVQPPWNCTYHISKQLEIWNGKLNVTRDVNFSIVEIKNIWSYKHWRLNQMLNMISVVWKIEKMTSSFDLSNWLVKYNLRAC